MAKLLIADDHPIFLEGLTRFLKASGHDVIVTARSGHEAVALLQTHTPDVAILDVTMKDGTGLDALKALRMTNDKLPVIFMTVSIDPQSTISALKDRVNGVVLKDSDPAELLVAIDEVLAGGTHMDKRVSEQALFYSMSGMTDTANDEALLTEREREIVVLARDGLRNLDIAKRCNLTEGTVKVHLHNIFQKLGVKSRAELIARAIKREAA
jgi:DNA-binding NarL/FixJ family response regulator